MNNIEMSEERLTLIESFDLMRLLMMRFYSAYDLNYKFGEFLSLVDRGDLNNLRPEDAAIWEDYKTLYALLRSKSDWNDIVNEVSKR